MKNFYTKYKYEILELLLVIPAWLVITQVVPHQVLDVLAYWCLGYYGLGTIVAPWVSKQLQKYI